MAAHLAGEHVYCLFLSGATEGFLDGKKEKKEKENAEQTSCCNYTSKPCGKSFDNNTNYKYL